MEEGRVGWSVLIFFLTFSIWPWLTTQYPPDVEQQCSTPISDHTFIVYTHSISIPWAHLHAINAYSRHPPRTTDRGSQIRSQLMRAGSFCKTNQLQTHEHPCTRTCFFFYPMDERKWREGKEWEKCLENGSQASERTTSAWSSRAGRAGWWLANLKPLRQRIVHGTCRSTLLSCRLLIMTMCM